MKFDPKMAESAIHILKDSECRMRLQECGIDVTALHGDMITIMSRDNYDALRRYHDEFQAEEARRAAEQRAHYVLGFLFDRTMKEVLLINKKKPKWQKGKLNGVGGSVAEGETEIAAMTRGGREELGLDIVWSQFGIHRGKNPDGTLFDMALFYAVDAYALLVSVAGATRVAFGVRHVVSPEGLDLRNVRVADIQSSDDVLREGGIPPPIPNLRWMIPMALSFRQGERTQLFEINERHE